MFLDAIPLQSTSTLVQLLHGASFQTEHMHRTECAACKRLGGIWYCDPQMLPVAQYAGDDRTVRRCTKLRMLQRSSAWHACVCAEENRVNLLYQLLGVLHMFCAYACCAAAVLFT